MKHVLSIADLTSKEITEILNLAKKLKSELKKKGANSPLFKNKTLVMIFEKPSLRTRLSFEIGMTQLGGHAVYLAPSDIGLGKRESIADASKVISRMGDIIMARVFSHENVREMAAHSSVPVINALSDLEHPCQSLADVMTMWEHKRYLKGLKVAFIGDGENNVTHSLALISGLLGMHFVTASPKGYWMNKGIVAQAKKFAAKSGGSISETTKPEVAAKNADVVYTDTWVSMGDEAGKEQRLKIFRPYRVTKRLMSLAKKDALFMHDLPAYRDNEVEADVIDGPKSVVFQQAENRLHVQKAILVRSLQK
ncbi:MAG: ornithine carbamoyltransferase [Parcubacteria group bacterium Gr01-1014_8]|nr:MAG: ornithine carbamoyltransferase [Parcubacteria group bacterium Gr01-1014_8]